MKSASVVVFVCLILGCESFAPTLYSLPKANRLNLVSQTRSLRVSPKASLTTEYYNVMATATNLLLAVDSDDSKVDRLYNGIPATGAVDVRSFAHITRLICIDIVLLAGTGVGSSCSRRCRFLDYGHRCPSPPQAGFGCVQ
jgi:hypothetical protein